MVENNNNNNNNNKDLYFMRATQSNTGSDFHCGPQILGLYLHASGHRVENCSATYYLLNNERDGAFFIFKDKEFHTAMPW